MMNTIRKKDRKLLQAIENNSLTLIRGYLSRGASVSSRQCMALKKTIENNQYEIFHILINHCIQHESYTFKNMEDLFQQAIKSKAFPIARYFIKKEIIKKFENLTGLENLQDEIGYKTLNMLLEKNYKLSKNNLFKENTLIHIGKKIANLEKNKVSKIQRINLKKVETKIL